MFMSSAANTISRPAPPIAVPPPHVVTASSGQTSAVAPHYIRITRAPLSVADSGRSNSVLQADPSSKSESGRSESGKSEADKGGAVASSGPASSSASKTSSSSQVSSAFNYDSETRRVVMQMRDGSGAVVVQIPSEQVLRQYEQAQKQVNERAGAASGGSPAGTGAEGASVLHSDAGAV